MQALVLAAGKGTRMRGLCDRLAKPMLPLANVPVIEHILNGLAPARISRARVVVGHCSDQISDHFDRKPHALRPVFIEQDSPTGTGSAALLGRDALGDEPFLLAFGDIIVSPDNYAGIVRAAGDWEAMLAVRRVPDPCHGAAVYVQDGRVARLIEKPAPGTSSTDLDSAGVFIFPPTIFERLEKLRLSPRGEYELTDAISAMLDDVRVGAYQMEGFWFNLTGPEALVAANEAVIESLKPAPLSDVSRCEIAGPVAIGRDCMLGKCRIGPGTSVGDGCVLEDGCAVSHSLLMGRAHIEGAARVEHAVVAEGAHVRADVIGRPDAVAVILR